MMCSIIVWYLIDIILVCEENSAQSEFVLTLRYIKWGVMQRWKWYANLSYS